MRFAFLARALSLALVLSIAARPARAAWPNSPSTCLPVCTAASSQQYTGIVSDGAGGAIVTWHDYRGGATSDIYAQHVLASGAVDPAWPANGRAVCTAANNQLYPSIISDGAGGAIVTWQDSRGGATSDIYAQHVLASGVVDPAWPADGRAVCTAANNQLVPLIVSDGTGGAIVTWMDFRGATPDVYAQHVLASGAVNPAWPADGRAVCTAAGDQQPLTIIPDGAGGAIVAWHDFRGGATSDIYAQHVLASGVVDPVWPANGHAVCTAAGDQNGPDMVQDGAGGAIISWDDPRSGANDIYAQHVLASGTVNPVWPVNGRAVCTAANAQVFARIVSDGAGGAIVTWQDSRGGATSDIYAQHVLASGVVDPAWPADGRALCTAPNDQLYVKIVADGAGGAIVTWTDLRGGATADIYAQHVLASGVVDPAWPADGRALCTAANSQQFSVIASDGAGGAIAAWTDLRAGAYDIYAQRVARFGYLGTPEAEIAFVRDVPNDQGGKVKLSWNASYLDVESDPNLAAYDVLRSVPPNLALARVRLGTRIVTRPDEAMRAGADRLFVTHSSAQTYYWEFLTSVNALHYVSGYSYLAPTAEDSTAAGAPQTLFMVVARNLYGNLYWPSRPDSGYSVDNLSPATATAFTAQYFQGSAPSGIAALSSSGFTWLHWNPSTEPDFLEYRLYRGTSSEFVPGPGTLLAAQPDTGHIDVGPAGGYYKLLALDRHGNASQAALLTPRDIVGVGSRVAPITLWLGPVTPNPAGAPVELRYGLPRETRVTLAIYDAAGRRVRGLVAGAQPAGEHVQGWDLRDDAGRGVGAGLYFIRLDADGRTLARRMATLR